jgi:hypothetical protein
MNQKSPKAKDAYRRACDMEKPLEAIRNFASALVRIAGTLDGDSGMIVYELVSTIQARVQELDNIHEYFFRLHHPDQERFEREGWPTEQSSSGGHMSQHETYLGERLIRELGRLAGETAGTARARGS